MDVRVRFFFFSFVMHVHRLFHVKSFYPYFSEYFRQVGGFPIFENEPFASQTPTAVCTLFNVSKKCSLFQRTSLPIISTNHALLRKDDCTYY